MLRRALLGIALLFMAGGALLLADEDVYVRGKDKPLRGKIKSESPKEVVLNLKDVVPAEDIIDIVYEPLPIVAKLAYREAVRIEKESLDPAKDTQRKGLLADSLKKFEDVLPNVTDKASKRQIEYKIAMLRVRQTQEDGEPADKALKKLKDFAKRHANSWQINRVLNTLGRMEVEAGDFGAAEATYIRLSELTSLPEEVRLDAKLLAVQVQIQGGKIAEAREKLAELQKELPKGSRYLARARVAEAEMLVSESKQFKDKDDPKKVKLFTQAIELVRGVIKDSNDRYVKAVGHNTLGYCYLEQGQAKDAMWEFLWVDVVYNQDRTQHAKALYHLWDLFTKEGDAPRAQECREALLGPQFAGLEYQRMVKDSKSQ